MHTDVKQIGRIPDGGGWRAHGRGAGSIQRDWSTKVGYDYVPSLINDHSRLAYSEVLPDERGQTCAAFLERAATYFAAKGIDRINRVMTDCAFAYGERGQPVPVDVVVPQLLTEVGPFPAHDDPNRPPQPAPSRQPSQLPRPLTAAPWADQSRGRSGGSRRELSGSISAGASQDVLVGSAPLGRRGVP